MVEECFGSFCLFFLRVLPHLDVDCAEDGERVQHYSMAKRNPGTHPMSQ